MIVEALCFATVMLILMVGVVVTLAWFKRWVQAYQEWTKERKYPSLWYEVPALFAVWALMFWLGIEVLS